MPILPMSWKSAPNSSRFSASRSSASSRPDQQRHVGDPAGVRRRVGVVRLERVGQRLDGRDERALEHRVVGGALDRQLGLVREAGEQPEAALAEVALADHRRQRTDPPALEPQRRHGEPRHALGGNAVDLRDLLGLEQERLRGLQPLLARARRRSACEGRRARRRTTRAGRDRGAASFSWIQSDARSVPSTRAVTSTVRLSTASGESAVASSRLASRSAFAISAASSCCQ